MNKPELEKELQRVNDLCKELKSNNTFLIKQQKVLQTMAEKAGSELAPYRAMVIRLQEELLKLESTLKTNR